MTKLSAPPASKDLMITLSRLLLPPQNGGNAEQAALHAEIATISREKFDQLTDLANENHVIIRVMEVIRGIARDAGDAERAEWAEAATAAEQARISNALSHLHAICAAIQEEGHDVTVIKSLDHWPDIGSDLDLYTNGKPEAICELMQRRFKAEMAARSWGDRLACKWNFEIPGLPESVEIHMRRLGQTGEQTTIAASLMKRTRLVTVNGLQFRVTSASDRLLISTLQRMYRHFYFRLCDILDSAGLTERGEVDFNDLRQAATAAGIWEGVATYMVIVSDYVKQYRGTGLVLPDFVRQSARFGGEQIYFAKDFLRVPIMPQSAKLYGTQLTGLLRKGEVHSSARLGLLPWLATAAAVGMKITGSDKGIW